MITQEDIDRLTVQNFDADLAGFTLESAKKELAYQLSVLDEVETWTEALGAFIRLNESAIS